MSAIHENFAREEAVAGGSPRAFGLLMAGVLALIALFNWWHDGQVWPWLGGAALLFALAALIYPNALAPMSRAWLKFGLLLHKVTNPLIMGLLFYGTVLPTGLIMRALGKDLLRLKTDPRADSYWIARQPPDPAAKTMTDQF